MIEIGSLVCIKNEIDKCIYIVKKVFDIDNIKYCLIQGLNHRITRTVEFDLIYLATSDDILLENKKSQKYFVGISSRKDRANGQRYVLGKILHIDGDADYLKKCLDLYNEVGVYVYGITLDEEKIKNEINEYLDQINPDVIVITGHDYYNRKGLKNIDNYTNTKYFVEAIKEIRKRRNDCCIIAGACQSNFEALIAAGADFASSPKRINIHTFDPAIIAIKVVTTSFLRVVEIQDILKYIENGKDAFGGMQTYGKMRLLL